MKLTHISLAVLTAIALTACSNDNDSTGNSSGKNDAALKAAQMAKEKAEKEAAAAKAEAEKLKKEYAALASSNNDTNIGEAKGNLDEIAEDIKGGSWLDKSSVSGQQYIRNKDSSFANEQNPTKDKKNASATALTSLPVTDKGLGNFVIAQEDTQVSGKDVKVLSYLGRYAEHKQNTGQPYDAIQNTNILYVLVDPAKNTQKTDFEDSTSNGVTNGLIAVNRFSSGAILGTEEMNNAKARFFGHFYKVYNTAQTNNTYLGAEQSKSAGSDSKYHLTAIAGKLDNVQYGRVTANLEVSAPTTSQAEKVNGRYVRHFGLDEHKSNKGVSVYFYRGTDETSLDDMKKLNGELNYAGHALTYGISHGNQGDGSSFPTAFANGWAEGIGSFVEAKYDVKKQEISGSIYDVYIKDNSQQNSELLKDKLVEFSGKVFGNTSKGNATLLAAHSDTGEKQQGDFKGSFYGKTAGELGGAINSVTNKEAYGVASSAWGVVFGAKATAVPAAPTSNVNWMAEDK